MSIQGASVHLFVYVCVICLCLCTQMCVCVCVYLCACRGQRLAPQYDSLQFSTLLLRLGVTELEYTISTRLALWMEAPVIYQSLPPITGLQVPKEMPGLMQVPEFNLRFSG